MCNTTVVVPSAAPGATATATASESSGAKRRKVGRARRRSRPILADIDEAAAATAKAPDSHGMSAGAARDHGTGGTDVAPPVFFMVGSQRSGSNWLETMINLSPDVSGPQPPHILKNWAPLVVNYGDLTVPGNYRALQDHVLAFVEAAPLPLVDAAGAPIAFERGAFAARVAKCVQRSASKKPSLVAILEAVFETEAEAHGKKTWICKSLTNIVHHAQLLEHFGTRRLRYIYLRRDPRDVCLSFKKCKSVGDDHYYVIARRWAHLQEQALAVEAANPALFFSVSYEELLNQRDFTMWHFFQFSGLEEPANGYDGAKTSARCERAAKGSERWGNLTRGRSFVAEQRCKYLKALEQGEMAPGDVGMIEAVAAGAMRALGYKSTVTVGAVFSSADIAEFERLNAEGVRAQRQALALANPVEAARVRAQADTLLAASTVAALIVCC